MAVVNSSSVKARPAPGGVAQPRHASTLESLPSALHHRRPRLPLHGHRRPTCRRRPSPSRTAASASGPARQSGSATRAPPRVPTPIPGSAANPALEPRAAAPVSQRPPSPCRSVLHSAATSREAAVGAGAPQLGRRAGTRAAASGGAERGGRVPAAGRGCSGAAVVEVIWARWARMTAAGKKVGA